MCGITIIIYRTSLKTKSVTFVKKGDTIIRIRKISKVLLKFNYAMKTYGGVAIYIQIFLTSALVIFTLRPIYHRPKSSRYTLERKLGDPRAGRDDVEKWKCLTVPGLEVHQLSWPARSQSLHYPGSHNNSNNDNDNNIMP